MKDARQYTIPVDAALASVRKRRKSAAYDAPEAYERLLCRPEEGADASAVEETIKTMPNYFSDYDTTVHFVSEEELQKSHSRLPHGGFVLRSGCTGWEQENNHLIEYSLKLDSNPEFTACVIAAYARAAYRLAKEGQAGCKTVFDIAPAYLSAKDGAALRAEMFNMMNKITYLMILFTTVFILQTGTGIISLPAALMIRTCTQSQTVDKENRHMIRTADHSMDEHALQNSMSSYRVIFRQALKTIPRKSVPA